MSKKYVSIYLVNSRILTMLMWEILYMTPFCTCACGHLCVYVRAHMWFLIIV